MIILATKCSCQLDHSTNRFVSLEYNPPVYIMRGKATGFQILPPGRQLENFINSSEPIAGRKGGPPQQDEFQCVLCFVSLAIAAALARG